MEEILASIRRIISEDGAPAKDSGESTQDPAGAAPTAVPAEAAAAPAPTPAGQGWGQQPVAGGPAAVDGDDALLLTEMVTDDGTVVSLATADEPSMGAPLESAAGDPLPEPPAPGVDELDLAPLDALPEPEPDLGASAAEPEPEAEPESAPAAKRSPGRPAPEPEPEPELSAEPEVEPEPEADLADEQEEPVMADPAKRPDASEDLGQHLVSDSTFATSAAALSQLSRTVRRDKDFPLGGGRMVEDLVREALEPMLREWLDANLAGIVERLVRQEIERMVRRAEEDS